MDHLQQILNRYRLHHLASLEDGLQGNTRTARGARENAEQALARFREQAFPNGELLHTRSRGMPCCRSSARLQLIHLSLRISDS